jgi:hypothetical protein
MIKQYRKKPVVIEAIQLSWENWNLVCDFVEKPFFDIGVYLDDKTLEELPDGSSSNTIGLKIHTSEGVMLAKQGDYIIKGIAGEFYPCKPDIFQKTYEDVILKSEGNDFKIIVNGREKVVNSNELSYLDVVIMATGNTPEENIIFTISFVRGTGNKPEGILSPGEKVPVKDGMIFNATITNNA